LMSDMAATRKNERYLPDMEIHERVQPIHDFAALKASSADLIVFVVPSKGLRAVSAQLHEAGVLRGGEVLLSCTKGIEMTTGMTMSGVLGDVFPDHRHAALSGPNHAEEISRQMPSAGVVACDDAESARALQACFTLPWFRCYTSEDVLGVEWAGAMKNVYAIAAGIARGLNLGDNAIAALVTRGLAEMVRLGVARGGQVETFYGLSGVGDLVATCYSEHSRNNRVGRLLGQGMPLSEIVASTRMIAEGVPNTESLWHSARQADVRTPLMDEVYGVLYENKSPKKALRELLGRDPRPEND
ncbi:MAG TPA: NAD(P)H-dependent glycerol-3-phosphate dehydrogenase, partial [Candidatus Saccharimonadia bacterium]|nr:NAD(P)H-dependent glycerol-3-phosphate dehydrogenase [Candidatus Saccharimonadia bacterium]